MRVSNIVPRRIALAVSSPFWLLLQIGINRDDDWRTEYKGNGVFEVSGDELSDRDLGQAEAYASVFPIAMMISPILLVFYWSITSPNEVLPLIAVLVVGIAALAATSAIGEVEMKEVSD